MGDDGEVSKALVTGHVALVLAWVLLFLIPALNGDPLPPEISFSQFGLHRWGWLFSIWAVLLPLSAWCYRAAGGHRTRWGTVLLVIGSFGCLVMAVVRTDAGGAQLSTNAQIHTAASVLALFGVPYACLAMLWVIDRRWRAAGVAVAAVHTISIVLLLIAATGVDTAGMGAEKSWAFWQFVAVLADHGLATLLAAAVWTSRRRRPAGSAGLTRVAA